MAHYASQTPKRHFAYSNSWYIRRLDKGTLQGWKDRTSGKVIKTAVAYKSKNGKQCYKGTPALKKTEILGPWTFHICSNLWVPQMHSFGAHKGFQVVFLVKQSAFPEFLYAFDVVYMIRFLIYGNFLM